MLKVTKASATILIFYILFYLQIWGDNRIILYGSAIVTVLSMVAYWFHENHIDLKNVPFGVWNNLIMVAYSLIFGYFVAFNYNTVISTSITFAAYSVVCIAICYVSNKEQSFEWVLNTLIALATLCAFYAIFFGAVWKGYGKTLSADNNPHFFAAVMNLGTFAIAYRIKEVKGRIPIIWTLLIGLFLYSIVQCGSRKYLIATALMLIIWVFVSVKERWQSEDFQQRTAAVFIFVGVIVLVYIFYRRFYMNTDIYSIMTNEEDMGDQKRIEFYQKALKIFTDSPIFGGGLDQFRYWGGRGSYAHSTYAEAIADFGFVGCVLYFSPILYASYQIFRKAFGKQKNYRNSQLLAFCIAELFIGLGQIFFMEFHHFIAWTILFYYAYEPAKTKTSDNLIQTKREFKYIR